MIVPRLSLNSKLVPVQYRGYDCNRILSTDMHFKFVGVNSKKKQNTYPGVCNRRFL